MKGVFIIVDADLDDLSRAGPVCITRHVVAPLTRIAAGKRAGKDLFFVFKDASAPSTAARARSSILS